VNQCAGQTQGLRHPAEPEEILPLGQGFGHVPGAIGAEILQADSSFQLTSDGSIVRWWHNIIKLS
jgi:hypothetical protein